MSGVRLPKRKILLNPGPLTVSDHVRAALLKPDICPREKEFCSVIRGVLDALPRVAHGEKTHEAVPVAGSGTAAIEACLASAAREPGSILVVDNGAYGERMARIARVHWGGKRVETFRLPHTQRPDAASIAAILKKRRAAYVALVHHETTTGMLNPAAQIARAAAEAGAGVILDAMSSYGGIPMDLRRDPYDFVISSSNKCLQGLPGLSFVVGRKSRMAAWSGRSSRSVYLDLAAERESLHRTGQTRFTPPVQVVYALEAALGEFFDETQERRYARITESWRELLAGLKKRGLKTLLPKAFHARVLTAVVEPEDPRYSFDEMHDYLYERDITIYPGKTPVRNTFRISVIGAIDRTDIARFLNHLDVFWQKKGIAR